MSFMEKFIAAGGLEAFKKPKGEKVVNPPPTQLATPKEQTVDRENDGRPRSKRKNGKGRRGMGRTASSRPRAADYEDSEHFDEDNDGDWSDNADSIEDCDDDEVDEPPRRKKQKHHKIRRTPVQAPPKKHVIHRIVKKGSGSDFLKYGKKFSKALTKVPLEVRHDLMEYIKPEYRRAIRAFLKRLSRDKTMRDSLTEDERTILFEDGNDALLKKLYQSKNPFDPAHTNVTDMVLQLIQEFEDAPKASKPPPPPKTAVKSNPKEPTSSSSDDDMDDDDDDVDVVSGHVQ